MPTLLVVDDEKPVRAFIKRAMSLRGWSVISVDSVASGLLVLRNCAVDAVISDLVMPRQSGLELVRQIRDIAPEVPVLLMSGHPDAELLAAEPMPRWWAPLALLEKPFTAADLLTALRHVTGHQS